MAGDSKVVGLWPRREQGEEPAVAFAPAAVPYVPAAVEDDDLPPPDWSRRAISFGCIAAGAAWLGLLTAVYARAWTAQAPGLPDLAGAIATAAGPLALLVVMFILLTRHDATAQTAAAEAARRLSAEQERLDATIARVAARLQQEYTDLAGTNDRLMSLGEEAGHRLKTASEGMRAEIETLGRYGQTLKTAATSARADLAVLLADLPKAQVETRQMVVALQEAGLAAHEKAGALDSLLAVLTERGREADQIAGGAAQKLAAHLARVESVSEASGARLEEAAQRMTAAIDATLARAAEANDSARAGIDAQANAMIALVDQTRAAMARTGADAATAIASRVEDVERRLNALGTSLAAQTEQSATLLEAVREGLEAARLELNALDDAGSQRSRALSERIGDLDRQAKALTQTLDAGNGAAGALIDRAEALITALDASARELEETLPSALERLDAKAAQALPQLQTLHGDAAATLDRLIEAEAVVARQRETLAALGKESTALLGANEASATKLLAAIGEAETSARALSEGAGAQLVEALVRVRETSNSAAEKAREAIAAVIPQAVGHLSEQTRAALADAVAEEVGKQVAELRRTAEEALAVATEASERLMRQMLTIADTSASVEARITTAREEAEAADKEHFTRRVALLIEALNSTSIDVAKLLSNDVTDSAWAAYLKGDRGVFTRRAVRLLDSGEAREVLRHYENEPEFREQVNRYIHDFEAMLRSILSTRDGHALSVTLLSSDMGKLYVALAQAIERLRT